MGSSWALDIGRWTLEMFEYQEIMVRPRPGCSLGVGVGVGVLPTYLSPGTTAQIGLGRAPQKLGGQSEWRGKSARQI